MKLLKKPLALSMGEPAGIGPDIALMAWMGRKTPPFLFIGNAGMLAERAAMLGLEVPVKSVSSVQKALDIFARSLPVLEIDLPHGVTPGRLDRANAVGVVEAIRRAVKLTMDGETAGVVTNPVHKKNLYDSGFAFPGHTEFLAELANGKNRPVMMLACEGLRVIPVTVHMPVSAVPAQLTKELIIETALIAVRDLETRFKIANPRLAVAGLNPHAGEEGSMGDEEIRIIEPAIMELRKRGIEVSGPSPADTLFHSAARKEYDAVLCMYHDQALIPVKTLDFERGVNITLGLPFVRTSPDHGTALELAGTGKASPESLIAALNMAAKLTS